ncbi:bile acid:sodium symporter family protein [Ammoniphilus sp. YIM 78166]|uniref:bile acid:sodium symporter family protein n=1 Tax=Ammoniphilus sp. YIM 78166 TaxID=1644106 RepID=UPI0010705B9D|nr:bile acid:sodium symporter family protein [Ammoniphilus sp. YIM 78166]
MLSKVNRALEKSMPLITPVSVLVGVWLGEKIMGLAFLVPFIFAFMTFAGSLSADFKSLGRVISHPFPILVALFVLHFLMPLWAWSFGHLVFSGDALTITGLILGMVIPTGITSMIWVVIYKGNIALGLSIIIIDTLLSPFIVPYSLSLFAGSMVQIDMSAMVMGLLGMIVIPSLLGMLFNQVSKGRLHRSWSPRLSPFSKIGLGVVVTINSATVAPYLTQLDGRLATMAGMVFFIAASGYFVSWLIAKQLKWDRENVIVLVFCGGMRNVSAGAVIAVSYFPGAVAAPIILAMVFQQILASLAGHLVARNEQKLTDAA